MGECPEWYPLLRAARYLNVAPWELIERPQTWTDWALAAESAEDAAREQLHKRAERKGRRRR